MLQNIVAVQNSFALVSTTLLASEDEKREQQAVFAPTHGDILPRSMSLIDEV